MRCEIPRTYEGLAPLSFQNSALLASGQRFIAVMAWTEDVPEMWVVDKTVHTLWIAEAIRKVYAESEELIPRQISVLVPNGDTIFT